MLEVKVKVDVWRIVEITSRGYCSQDIPTVLPLIHRPYCVWRQMVDTKAVSSDRVSTLGSTVAYLGRHVTHFSVDAPRTIRQRMNDDTENENDADPMLSLSLSSSPSLLLFWVILPSLCHCTDGNRRYLW